MLFKNAIIISLSVFLFSCAASYAKKDVANGDWAALGAGDAQRGMPKKSIKQITKLNEKYGLVEANYSQYESEYNKGLIEFCNVENAFKLGLSGHSYQRVCDDMADGDEFYKKWDIGRRAFTSK
jgi:hypothetical protein